MTSAQEQNHPTTHFSERTSTVTWQVTLQQSPLICSLAFCGFTFRNFSYSHGQQQSKNINWKVPEINNS